MSQTQLSPLLSLAGLRHLPIKPFAQTKKVDRVDHSFFYYMMADQKRYIEIQEARVYHQTLLNGI